MSDDVHEVYAIKYGEHMRKRSDNYVFGDPHDEMTELTYFVWVIKGPHGTFMVDTGFDEVAAKERGRHISRPVDQGLNAIGVDPAKVEHVIATHMHWDHAGNYDLFPNARYHIQDDEMAYATGRCMCHPMLRIPFSESDVHAMVKKVFAFRCEFHDGADELAPGISDSQDRRPLEGPAMRPGEDQTRRCRARVGLLPSLFAHRRRPRVSDHLFGRRHAGRLQEAAKLAPSRQHIVPGHDPDVLKIYPAAGPGLEDWMVRLDVAPKV